MISKNDIILLHNQAINRKKKIIIAVAKEEQ